MASGKAGIGIEDIMKAVVDRIPAPKGDPDAPLQCLIFDSVFNQFRGIIAYYRILNGTLRKGDKVRFIYTGNDYDANELGILQMTLMPKQEMKAG